MMASVGAAMLMAQAMSGPAASPLLDQRHEHEWVAGYADHEHRIFVDRKWIGHETINGKTFPVVLVRSQLFRRQSDPIVLDALTAVDCKRATTAMLRIWNSMEGAATTHTPQPASFSNALLRHRETAQAVMSFACNKETKSK